MLTLGSGSSCDVCFEDFGQDRSAPCSIPCGHIYCVGCISQISLCPLCRTAFSKAACRKLYVDIDAISSEKITGSFPNNIKIIQSLASIETALSKCNTFAVLIKVVYIVSITVLILAVVRLKVQSGQLLVEKAELSQRLKEFEETQDVDRVLLHVVYVVSITALILAHERVFQLISGILNAIYPFLYPVNVAAAEKGQAIALEDDGPRMRIHNPDSLSSPSLPDMPSSHSPASLASSDHEGTVPRTSSPGHHVGSLNSSTTSPTTWDRNSHFLASGPHQGEKRRKSWRVSLGDVFFWKRRPSSGNAHREPAAV